MRRVGDRFQASPTDLANFLSCRHKTFLDWLVAAGQLQRPLWTDPLAEVLRQRGEEHEKRYVVALRDQGLEVVDLSGRPPEARLAQTREAMRSGAEVIVQGALADDQWFGYPDVLRKVTAPSPAFGAWSYEAHDTKLSRETRGGTILQLCLYSELVGAIQGRDPEWFHVVTPIAAQAFRVDDFSAFYRQVIAAFLEFVSTRTIDRPADTYPDPVEHCDVCRWWARCNAERRRDDHLTFVAGLGRMHQAELQSRGIRTLQGLATAPRPLEFKPARGARETYERLREQARLQLLQRECGQPRFELLPAEPQTGLCRLPEPRPGDLFLDLEGDPFGRALISPRPGEGGREYLFGLGRVQEDGAFVYRAYWAFTDSEERQAFEAVMTDIMTALDEDPSIHIYHYAPYEPAAFKRLMGRYVTREADMDRLLRGGRFVDLYAIVRQALRAGIERYSIKDLEPFYEFRRDVDLRDADAQRRLIELAIETGDAALVTPAVREAVEGYNRDDCRSARELQQWLEALRAQQIAAGTAIPRPPLEPDQPSENVSERQQQIERVRRQLLVGVPDEAGDRSPEEHAKFLLAYLLDWHYREDKVVWWEYFRLLDLSDDELFDEPDAVAGLEFVEQVDVVRHKTTGRPTGSVIDRYRYPPQECEIRRHCELTLRDQKKFGVVVGADRAARTLDVRKGPSMAEIHPASAFTHERISPDVPAAALLRLGEQAAAGGLASAPKAVVDLLLRETAGGRPGTSAVHTVLGLEEATLPIQGPPGSGKTFTGAQMICALVGEGKRVGVTATSHKVIRNLLDAVEREARRQQLELRLGQKIGDSADATGGVIAEFEDNTTARDALALRHVGVLGGTAWLWSRPEFYKSVDVLFIDEAGQMSLANAVAVSQATATLVLLGDPQQLQQPQKGSHPDGVSASALDHVLEGHKTMPEERGLFLPITWRLAPSICRFTSEVFYERKLESKPGLEQQRLTGAGACDGAGLFLVELDHDGCRNACTEEIEIVASLFDHLRGPGVEWVDECGHSRPVGADDMLIIAPYNAQVSRLQERLGHARVGTVDRFQGQEAPVVIYSMTTSRPEDAPRGLEFLYSLNRLNVATSRARCVVIIVASRRLFQPDCRTPRQMQLANALARYRELSVRVDFPPLQSTSE